MICLRCTLPNFAVQSCREKDPAGGPGVRLLNVLTKLFLKAAGLPLWNFPVQAKRERRIRNQEKSRMKLAFYAALAAALFILSPQLVSAQVAAGDPCKVDRDKFCPGIKPGGGNLAACMKKHDAELSPECVARRQESRQSRMNIRANCKADTGKFCADAGKEPRATLKCLESHSAELEPACADALKSRPGAKKS